MRCCMAPGGGVIVKAWSFLRPAGNVAPALCKDNRIAGQALFRIVRRRGRPNLHKAPPRMRCKIFTPLFPALCSSARGHALLTRGQHKSVSCCADGGTFTILFSGSIAGYPIQSCKTVSKTGSRSIRPRRYRAYDDHHRCGQRVVPGRLKNVG